MNAAIDLEPGEISINLFAGGGGTAVGYEMALGRAFDIAINHDPIAIAMSRANHPHTEYFCESIRDVSPTKACRGRKAGFLWASPDCRHFSKAKGGKPVDKQIRGLAWMVIRWAREVAPRIIMVENVEEFQSWGPLLPDGTPCPVRKSWTFRRWVGALKKLGYRIEYRELVAADYGAPTSRKRLFVVARRDGKAIVWPKATHGEGPGLTPYQTASQCIDWSLPMLSVFATRAEARAWAKYHKQPGIPQRPMAENSMRRVARSVRRYVQEAPRPFIVPLTHHGDRRPHPLREPVPTVTGAQRGELALVAPALVRLGQTGELGGDSGKTQSVEEGLTTITSKAEHMLMCANLIKHYGGNESKTGGKPLDVPFDTVTAIDHHSLLVSHLQRDFGRSIGSALEDPAGAITAGGGGKLALVTSHLVHFRGGTKDHLNTAQALDGQMPAVTAQGLHIAECRALLVKYYGTGGEQRLTDPLDTVTTKDRFALVMIENEEWIIADLLLRMLSPRELFRAQGFPESYQIRVPIEDTDKNGRPRKRFLNKTEQVKLCGNSVCPPVAAALIFANVASKIDVMQGPSSDDWLPGLVKPGEQIPLFDLAEIA